VKPDLIVDGGNLPAAAHALRDLIAKSGTIFDRDGPARIVRPSDGGLPLVTPLTPQHVVLEAHRLARPVNTNGNPITLTDRVAKLYLALSGEWGLSPLVGISSAPLLADDGSIRLVEGYDTSGGLWCMNLPQLTMPDRPSRADAEAALLLLRQTFRTFPFADSVRIFDRSLRVEVVDLEQRIGADESALLHGLLTAVCRSSLRLAPGLVMTAPVLSGAAVGKGLLARALSLIAFGSVPHAFTMDSNRDELDKRLVAALLEARPFIFLDNVNGVALRSDTLASVMTERPAHVRILSVSRMATLNSAAFICVTGNGLTMTEDLVRRFLLSELDARCEDPEQREFQTGFLEQIERRRSELLAAALTIWRWGRQTSPQLTRGRSLGSFERWAQWCRDPLLALGCPDPVERVRALKGRDTGRQRVAEILELWWASHRSAAMKVADLADPLKNTIDPQGRSRQHLVSAVQKLAGTRAAGFVLTRQEPAGRWGTAAYRLVQTSDQTAAPGDLPEESAATTAARMPCTRLTYQSKSRP
jgi:putative DNA primase/helicase